jgi:regulator of protease activity HflC (stomatin/prohibitin superfamily)
MYKEESGFPLFLVITFFVIIFVGWAYYNFISPNIYVWQQSMAGQAELAHAEYSRQIATCEAMAKKESAKALADAEVIRAEGVAKANKIIGDSLAGNEGYLRYLWIQGLQTNNMQVIYVPCEGGLPILESVRLKNDR